MWGPGWSPDVAHALLRAVSRLISTPALLFDTVCESCARTGRREESRRGTQECVRYVGDPTSGGLRLATPEVADSSAMIGGTQHVLGRLPQPDHPRETDGMLLRKVAHATAPPQRFRSQLAPSSDTCHTTPGTAPADPGRSSDG